MAPPPCCTAVGTAVRLVSPAVLSAGVLVSIACQLSHIRRRLLARPLTASLCAGLLVLALRQLLSLWRRRLERGTWAVLSPPRFVLDAKEDFHAFVFSHF